MVANVIISYSSFFSSPLSLLSFDVLIIFIFAVLGFLGLGFIVVQASHAFLRLRSLCQFVSTIWVFIIIILWCYFFWQYLLHFDQKSNISPSSFFIKLTFFHHIQDKFTIWSRVVKRYNQYLSIIRQKAKNKQCLDLVIKLHVHICQLVHLSLIVVWVFYHAVTVFES